MDTFASALIQLIPRFYTEQVYRTGSGPGQYGNSSMQTLERALHVTCLAVSGIPCCRRFIIRRRILASKLGGNLQQLHIDAARSNAPDRFLGNNDYT